MEKAQVAAIRVAQQFVGTVAFPLEGNSPSSFTLFFSGTNRITLFKGNGYKIWEEEEERKKHMHG